MILSGFLAPSFVMASTQVMVVNPSCQIFPTLCQGRIHMTLTLPSADVLEKVSIDPSLADTVQLQGSPLKKVALPDGILDLNSKAQYLLLTGLKKSLDPRKTFFLSFFFQKAGLVQVPIRPSETGERQPQPSFCKGDPRCAP